LLLQIKAHIESHVDTEIFLMDISEATGYSSNYLSRFFSKATGITITDFIAEKKLERITALMKQPELNLTDIAKMTGFQSRTYFNTYFKRIAGKAPSQYRELLATDGKEGINARVSK
jgi:two-component system response regulator YesN